MNSISTGSYSLLPAGLRIIRKIESIIRDEMNKIEGQEVLLPVVLPRELWEESGRWDSVGSELLRFTDRTGKDMLLGMTHEEAVVHLARNEVSSYKNFPFMLYQIQTKYRDEPRSRGGLIRVKEFTMKDAYSFHTSQKDLEEYYEKAHNAYMRIFKRAGLKNIAVVQSDSGMMGGAVSHEYMLVTPGGEDTLIMCPACDYRANREVALGNVKPFPAKPAPLEKVHTPNCKTIEEVAAFLNIPTRQTGKAVFFADNNNQLVFAVIRGDREVNEAKIKKIIQSPELRFATDQEITASGAVPGYASVIGIDPEKVKIIIDPTVAGSGQLTVGANEKDYHFINFDLGPIKNKIITADIISIEQDDQCPCCGAPLNINRGIEVGNIFQLGTKYTRCMNMTYLDAQGKSQFVIMGCYGIGVGRLMASVIEDSLDKFGPVWPISIAPWQVHINALNLKLPEVKEAAENLYRNLIDKGIEVLFDDRDEKAGPQFAEADLLGIPIRLVLSKKTVADNECEFKLRGSMNKKNIPLESAFNVITETINTLENEISSRL
jgi:prolyl-tRNA synthetase